jgi:hypothetical protein
MIFTFFLVFMSALSFSSEACKVSKPSEKGFEEEVKKANYQIVLQGTVKRSPKAGEAGDLAILYRGSIHAGMDITKWNPDPGNPTVLTVKRSPKGPVFKEGEDYFFYLKADPKGVLQLPDCGHTREAKNADPEAISGERSAFIKALGLKEPPASAKPPAGQPAKGGVAPAKVSPPGKVEGKKN